jgi:hypothetical protein
MLNDLKKMYKTVMDDHFPPEITISFGGQTLFYRKRTWRIQDEDSGELIEKGLRYGENPGQEAAMYELVNGNLCLGMQIYCTRKWPGICHYRRGYDPIRKASGQDKPYGY